METTSIFLDWSNVFIYAKNLDIRIDPTRLCDFVSKDKNIVQKNYFSAVDPNNKRQIKFHEGLKKRGFIIHTHDLVERPEKIICPKCRTEVNFNCNKCNTLITLPPHKSKRIDVLIALNLLKTSNIYNEAILISEDQDFIPIIDYLRYEMKKKITIVAFKKLLSYEYNESCDKIIILDDYIEEIKQIVKPHGGL